MSHGIFALCCGLVLLATPAQGALDITMVLANGDPAPGTGGSFTGFGDVVINDAGTIAFHGYVVGPGNSGLWRLSGATPERLVATGQVPPGAPDGQTLDWIDGILLPQSGDTVVFRTEFLGSEEAYYEVGPGGLSPIVIEGQAAPGTDAVFDSIRASMRVSAAGEIAFFATLSGGTSTSSNSTGIWSGSAGDLALVARQGEPAPGGDGDTWFILDSYPRISPSGTVGFASVLFGSNGYAGVWTGAPVPGLPSAFAPLSDYRSAFLSENDELLFLEFNSASGYPMRLRAGLPDDFRTVISDGDEAPGLPPGVVVRASWPWLEARMNRRRQVAFRTETQEEPRRLGLWSEGSGVLELLALQGEVAPGTGGLHFDEIEAFEVNDLGQTAFVADLDGLSGRGLFLVDPGEPPQLVARGEGWLQLTPGDMRQVSGLNVSLESADFLSERERGALNDAGELVFSLSFYDGTSGLFVARVPEPGGAALCLGALLTLGGLCRCRARDRA
jgi:hypothetical protein